MLIRISRYQSVEVGITRLFLSMTFKPLSLRYNPWNISEHIGITPEDCTGSKNIASILSTIFDRSPWGRWRQFGPYPV